MTLLRYGTDSQQYDFTAAGVLVQSYNDNFHKALVRTTRLPGRHGGVPTHGYTFAREIGKVTASLTLITDTRDGMDAQRRALRRMAAWGKTRLFRRMNGVVQWCEARVNNIGYTVQLDQHSDLMQPVQVTWQVTDPYWYQLGTEAWRWDDGTLWGAEVWDGSAPAQALNGNSSVLTVTPGGNRYTLPRFVLACAAGQTLHDPVIERVVDGAVVDRLSYSGTLTAGDTLAINVRAKLATHNGAAVSISTLYDRWFRLLPQTNTLRVTTSDAGDRGTLYAYYYERVV